MPSIDVRSADILLAHDGSDRGAAGAPARDLSASDIGRLAYRRELAAVIDRVGQPIDPAAPDAGVVTRPDPRDPDPMVVAAVLDELLASGRYTEAGKKTAKPKADPPPTDDAAAAADKPEA